MPGHAFWGIALYEDQEQESVHASCWERANRPEDLGWSSDVLHGLIATAFERSGAAALMIVTDGQVVFELGNTASNFLAHSMRKSLMSAVYGTYVDEGQITLSRTLANLNIDDILPLTATEKQATVLDLLKARSGVYIPAAGEAASMSDDRPDRGSHKPGTHWYYNNWDFNALATILDQETGGNFYEAFNARIADPVGMQDFFPERLQYSYEYWLSEHPYYGTRISARDLARFGQLFLEGGSWQGAQVVPREWVEVSSKVHSMTGDTGTYSGYGYMWWIAAEQHGAISKGAYAASGYGGHTLEILPDLNTIIVFRVNTDATGWQPIDDPDEAVLGILSARLE
jgi:CubicO group peptidase (beta-lactamase class C family)